MGEEEEGKSGGGRVGGRVECRFVPVNTHRGNTAESCWRKTECLEKNAVDELLQPKYSNLNQDSNRHYSSGIMWFFEKQTC